MRKIDRSNKREAYTTFTSCQNAARSKKVFFLCWVDYTLEGSTENVTLAGILVACFTLRGHDTYRFTVVITGAQPKAGTGLKTQTVSVVFSTLHCVGRYVV